MKHLAEVVPAQYPKMVAMIDSLDQYKRDFSKFKKQTKRDFLAFQDRHEELWDGIFDELKAENLLPPGTQRDHVLMEYNGDTGKLTVTDENGTKKELKDLLQHVIAIGDKNGWPVPQEFREAVGDSGEPIQDGDEAVTVH